MSPGAPEQLQCSRPGHEVTLQLERSASARQLLDGRERGPAARQGTAAGTGLVCLLEEPTWAHL